jgi:phosphatidylglycerophosphatase A
MADPELEGLVRRLDRIERGLRLWRVLAVIAWSALATGVGVSLILMLSLSANTVASDEEDESDDSQQVVEDEVRARAFVLVDDDGRPRAALAMRPDGSAALAFSTPDGQLVWKAP